MRIFLTGDLHGEIGIRRLGTRQWALGKTLSKEDILLIAGDFGLVYRTKEGKENDEERYWLDWLESKPWTTAFIDGNHENFAELLSYPEKKMFGGIVGVLRPSVIHLKQRGHVYTIGGKRIWCCGGAYSTDKRDRTIGKSWWPEEEMTMSECNLALEKLRRYGHVNFALTHDAPESLLEEVIYDGYPFIPSKTTAFMDSVLEIIRTKKWFFGHHHIDKNYSYKGIRFRAIYKDIVEVL